MSNSRRNPPHIETPMAALLDMSFLLLAYFVMMANDVKDESFVAINQPALNPGPPPPVMPTTCEIYVRPDAYISRGQPYPTVDGLFADLAHFADNSEVDPDDPQKQRKNVIVNLKLSVHATQQQLVDLLDVLAKYKLTKINFFYLKGAVDAPVP